MTGGFNNFSEAGKLSNRPKEIETGELEKDIRDLVAQFLRESPELSKEMRELQKRQHNAMDRMIRTIVDIALKAPVRTREALAPIVRQQLMIISGLEQKLIPGRMQAALDAVPPAEKAKGRNRVDLLQDKVDATLATEVKLTKEEKDAGVPEVEIMSEYSQQDIKRILKTLRATKDVSDTLIEIDKDADPTRKNIYQAVARRSRDSYLHVQNDALGTRFLKNGLMQHDRKCIEMLKKNPHAKELAKELEHMLIDIANSDLQPLQAPEIKVPNYRILKKINETGVIQALGAGGLLGMGVLTFLASNGDHRLIFSSLWGAGAFATAYPEIFEPARAQYMRKLGFLETDEWKDTLKPYWSTPKGKAAVEQISRLDAKKMKVIFALANEETQMNKISQTHNTLPKDKLIESGIDDGLADFLSKMPPQHVTAFVTNLNVVRGNGKVAKQLKAEVLRRMDS